MAEADGESSDFSSDSDDEGSSAAARLRQVIQASQAHRAGAAPGGEQRPEVEQAHERWRGGPDHGVAPSQPRGDLIRQALARNLQLQEAYRVQVDAVERALALNERTHQAVSEAMRAAAADRGLIGERSINRNKQSLLALPPTWPPSAAAQPISPLYAVVQHGAPPNQELDLQRAGTTRPSVVQPTDPSAPGERPPLTTDARRLDALTAAVPVHATGAWVWKPWSAFEREVLRSGIVENLMGAAHRDMLRQLDQPGLTTAARRTLQRQLKWLQEQGATLEEVRVPDDRAGVGVGGGGSVCHRPPAACHRAPAACHRAPAACHLAPAACLL